MYYSLLLKRLVMRVARVRRRKRKKSSLQHLYQRSGRVLALT